MPMGEIKGPESVKVFAGVLYRDEAVLERAVAELRKRLGKIAVKSPVYDFTFTDYYEKEMGAGLKKVFIGFEAPADPGRLAEIKVATNEMEDRFSVPSGGVRKRAVNIDPGYVDSAKVVLATTKDRGHRIYLGSGVYGEVTLIYSGGRWQPLPWTYPDYRTSLASRFFTGLRNL
ncbi:MAG: DUF4416 family protein [Methanobacteriota archaeon]|nr:MAG: DUF4416 family protein [Euryarchaeota archaeon]